MNFRFAGLALFALLAAPQPCTGTTREHLIHRFHNIDGASPKAALLVGPNGTLYGTTSEGGVVRSNPNACFLGCGTVFKLEPSASGYKRTVLYDFQGDIDGATPLAGLVADAAGALYGTTSAGGGRGCAGRGCGTVFELVPVGGRYREIVLHAFLRERKDGEYPLGGVTIGSDGSLYGTTVSGGFAGRGTVYKLLRTPSGYVEQLIHVFERFADGAGPASTLVIDAGGALYGTTQTGGTGSVYGTVFKLTPRQGVYDETILHDFGVTRGDGWEPLSGLALDPTGALYGTTPYGGRYCGCGTVYKLTPAGSGYLYRVVFNFGRPIRDGYQPLAPVTLGPGGVLYGTTYTGGWGYYYKWGTVFKLTPAAPDYVETVLHRFGRHDAVWPAASVVWYDGRLYGTTVAGYGLAPFGAVFSVAP